MTGGVAADLRAAVLSLNGPAASGVYAVDGEKITGRWNYDNAELAERLRDGGASANFRYVVTLQPEDQTFRCSEEDAGYNNGQIRAYRGYSRNYNVNLLSLIVGFAQRAGRKRRTGQAEPDHKYTQEELKVPLRNVLESKGWQRKGVIR